MGIHAGPAQTVKSLRLPKGFSVCELGDQYLTQEQPHVLAEQFYRALGCGRYVSIDGNGRGTLTLDLNRKLPIAIKPFDVVTDFGTGEHIFNQAQVWATIHSLTKPHGYIVFDRPATGYPTHCFYLTQECLFRDLARANGYRIVTLTRRATDRGEMIHGVFQRLNDGKFQMPQQGRYVKALQI